MQKICLIGITLVCLVVAKPAYAQFKTAEERAQERTKIMTCELKLTQEEIPKVYEVNLHAARRMDSAYTRYNNRRGPIKRQGKVVDKERDVALRRVLTADHYSLYLKIEQEDIDALKQTEDCRASKKKK
jgi:hypothetical protein